MHIFYAFKAIANLSIYDRKVKNTNHTIPCQKSYFFLSAYFPFSSTTFVFVSRYRSNASYTS